MSYALVRLRPEQTGTIFHFCDEKARADLADYRLAAAMFPSFALTRKISDSVNSHCEAS
jgi:hypothetical protein